MDECGNCFEPFLSELTFPRLLAILLQTFTHWRYVAFFPLAFVKIDGDGSYIACFKGLTGHHSELKRTV